MYWTNLNFNLLVALYENHQAPYLEIHAIVVEIFKDQSGELTNWPILPILRDTLLVWLKIPSMHPSLPSQRDTKNCGTFKCKTSFDPIRPFEHEQVLKLSCVTTWSFRRCSIRHGGLNLGLVSLSIKQHEMNISVKNQLHPPPTVPLRSRFDICVKQGLLQILPLQA